MKLDIVALVGCICIALLITATGAVVQHVHSTKPVCTEDPVATWAKAVIERTMEHSGTK